MQEDQTVGFEPMFVDGPMPWFRKLFALYLLIVFVVFLAKLFRLGLDIRKLRKTQKNPGALGSSDALWKSCSDKVRSFKELSTLTFLLALLDFTWYASDVLMSLRSLNAPNAPWILPRIGQGLVDLAAGLVLCTGLYLAALLSQAAMKRRVPGPASRADLK